MSPDDEKKKLLPEPSMKISKVSSNGDVDITFD